MGHGQMLRVSMVDGWLNRPRGTDLPAPTCAPQALPWSRMPAFRMPAFLKNA